MLRWWSWVISASQSGCRRYQRPRSFTCGRYIGRVINLLLSWTITVMYRTLESHGGTYVLTANRLWLHNFQLGPLVLHVFSSLKFMGKFTHEHLLTLVNIYWPAEHCNGPWFCDYRIFAILSIIKRGFWSVASFQLAIISGVHLWCFVGYGHVCLGYQGRVKVGGLPYFLRCPWVCVNFFVKSEGEIGSGIETRSG